MTIEELIEQAKAQWSVKRHKQEVAMLGCIVCENLGFEDSPACLHHIREGQGGSQRASDWEVIPLCPAHHQFGGEGVAFHATGRDLWESSYGAEQKLLEQVYRQLGF